jgi:hypothetical protein
MEHDTTREGNLARWCRYDILDRAKGRYSSFLDLGWMHREDLADLMRDIELGSKRIDSERSDSFELLDTIEGFS